jgi:hypothetical protein
LPKNETGRGTKIVFIKPFFVIDQHEAALTYPLGGTTRAGGQLLKLAKAQPGSFAPYKLKRSFGARGAEREGRARPNAVVAWVILDKRSRPRRDPLVECMITPEVHHAIGIGLAQQTFCHTPNRLRSARANETESHDGFR